MVGDLPIRENDWSQPRLSQRRYCHEAGSGKNLQHSKLEASLLHKSDCTANAAAVTLKGMSLNITCLNLFVLPIRGAEEDPCDLPASPRTLIADDVICHFPTWTASKSRTKEA